MKHGFLAAKARRIFSVLLCLLMLASVFPLGAYAEGTETAPAVRFLCDETVAQVTVYDTNGATLPTGADGLHHLTPGTYYYSAEAEGYESTGRQAFTVPYGAVGDQELRITMTPVAGSTAPTGMTGNQESGGDAGKADDAAETKPEDDGKLRIYPADGPFHLTVDGVYETSAAVPAELQTLVAGKDRAAGKPANGTEASAVPEKKLYLKQPVAEELYLDRLALEKELGFASTDWTIVNLVDEEGERKVMRGSYDVTVSGPAMDRYAGFHPVFALLTLHWDEEGDIVDRDVSIIETTSTPSGSSYSFRTDTLSTLLIVVPTSTPYQENGSQGKTAVLSAEEQTGEEEKKEAKTSFTVTYVAGEGGSISKDSGAGTDEIRIEVRTAEPRIPTVFVQADAGYEFKSWTDGDGNFVYAGTQLPADEVLPLLSDDVTLYANFDPVNPEPAAAKKGLRSTAPAATKISSATITVTPPAAGSSSDTAPVIAIPDGANYTVSNLRWCDSSGRQLTSSMTFVLGEIYYLTASVAANEGYDFQNARVLQCSGGTITNEGKDGYAKWVMKDSALRISGFEPVISVSPVGSITAIDVAIEALGAGTVFQPQATYAGSGTAPYTVGYTSDVYAPGTTNVVSGSAIIAGEQYDVLVPFTPNGNASFASEPTVNVTGGMFVSGELVGATGVYRARIRLTAQPTAICRISAKDNNGDVQGTYTNFHGNPETTSRSYSFNAPAKPGTEFTVTAYPNNGYYFTGWYAYSYELNRPLYLVSYSSPYTFTANEATGLQAWFFYDAECCILSGTGGGGVAASFKNASGAADSMSASNLIDDMSFVAKHNTGVTLTATPQENYAFVGWYEYNDGVLGNCLSTDLTYTFNFTAQTSIRAVFSNTQTIRTKYKVVKESTIYAGEISVDGVSQLSYLYSPDITVGPVVFDNLHSALAGTTLQGLVPTIANDATPVNGFFRYTGTVQQGTSYTADTDYTGGVSEDWSSVTAVAGRCFTGIVGTEASGSLPAASGSVDESIIGKLFDNGVFYSTLSVGYASEYEEINGVMVKVAVATLNNEGTQIVYTTVNVTTTYAVNVTANPTAGGTVTGGGSFTEGSSVTVTATPTAGYRFVNWTENGVEVSTSAEYNFNATAARNLTANFELITYTATVTNDGNGTGTADPASGTMGTEVTLTATPNENYQFKEWQVISGSVTVTGNKFTIGTENVEIKAVFERVYNVNVTNNDGNGTGSADPASGPEGTEVNLTATPKEGYRLKEWQVVSGGVTVTDNRFTIGTENVEIQAVFELIPTYTVQFNVDGGPDVPDQTVTEGDRAAKPADPIKEDFVFADWYGDAALTVPFDFNTAITAETIVYAKWIPAEYVLISVTGTTEDASHTWTKGSTTDVEITAKRNDGVDRSFARFTGVRFGSATLTGGTDYDAHEGSTVVTLRAAMLEEHETGTYPVTLLFDNGEVTTNVTIRSASVFSRIFSPKTGDESSPALWTALLVLSGLGLAGGAALARKKRRRMTGRH